MERQLCFRNSYVLHLSQNVVTWVGLPAGSLGHDRLIVLMYCYVFLFFFLLWRKKKELYWLYSFSFFTLKSSNTSLQLRRKPRESDFETIKLISNGAYGWVIHVTVTAFSEFCITSQYFLLQGWLWGGFFCTAVFILLSYFVVNAWVLIWPKNIGEVEKNFLK